MTVFANLDKQFNNVIKYYLDRGFCIPASSQRSSLQGAITYVDLKHPKDKQHIVRVWLTKDCRRQQITDDTYYYVNYIDITAKTYTIPYKGCIDFSINEGLVMSHSRFYVIKSSCAYTDSLDELINIHKLQINRRKFNAISIESLDHNNHRKEFSIREVSPNMVDYLMKRINAVHGFKRATASCVDSISLQKFHTFGGNRCVRGLVRFTFNGHTDSIII